ncbi:putative F-box domain-containing protein [Tanacetum coccineum]|uniref:F-box domain-containing protein n=1 Tax=Tanacetum coccineum TaxID=301880 RepID=A0ABQ5FWM7_9ASTR
MAMAHGYPMAVIWNPSIRKSGDIVMSSKYDWSMYNTIVGFGVCPSTFDVKLVKITYIKDDDPFYDSTQVEVFTLSSGAWKSLSINLPRESIRFTQDYSMDLDGFIYWLAIDHDGDAEGKTEGHNMIMSFDMRSENFIEISLPRSLVDADYTHLSISKWMESLVVLEYNLRARKPDYNVWMMKDGVQKSFAKLFTIEAPEAPIRRVLRFRKSGEPIITMHSSRYDVLGVYHYEPNSRHISYIRICTDWPDSHLASSYTDTLLLLDQ